MQRRALITPVQAFSSEELTQRTIERRGVEAAIWAMPIVNSDAMRQAHFRDAKAAYGDIRRWQRQSSAGSSDAPEALI